MPLAGLEEALREAERATGARMSTMRRGLDEDAAAFLAAAAAGRLAGALLGEGGRAAQTTEGPSPRAPACTEWPPAAGDGA